MFYRPHARFYSPSGERSMTRQEYKAECDIYTILQQFQETGVMKRSQTAQPLWGELPDDIDFQTAMNITMAANDAFASLPSAVRSHFQNDPARFLAAMYDSTREDELRKLGLLNAKPPVPLDPPSSSANGS